MTSEFEVIATRELEAAGEGISGVRRVLVEIGKPYPDPVEVGDWKCEYRIRGLDHEHGMVMTGVDGIQAIQAALTAISGAVDMLQDPPNIILTFNEHTDLMFP